MDAKLRLAVWGTLLAGAAGGVAACEGERANPQPVVEAGADVVVPVDAAPDVEETFDGGVEEEGGVIADGGGNPDETEGGVIDAGKDASTCGPPSGNGATFSSTCSSYFVIAGGGTVVAATYHLTGYTLFGSAQYCSGTFKSATYSGKLVVTKGPNGTYTFVERVSQSGALYFPPTPGPNKNFTVTPIAKALSVSQSCGVTVADTSWPYTAGGTSFVHTLAYTRTVGSASVRFAWTQD